MSKGGNLGKPNSLLARILQKWKEEQEELLRKLREVRSKLFYAPEIVPDLGKRGEYDRNGFLSFYAPDTFMKKHNLKEHVGKVLMQTGNYKYSVPFLKVGYNHYSGLEKILKKLLPPQYRFNLKKQELRNQESSLLLQKRSAPSFKTSASLRLGR